MASIALRRPTHLALVAFLLHAPGLRLVAGHRLDRRATRANVLALGATVLAAALAAALATHPVRAAIAAWIVGHCAWGAWLAVYVFRRASRASPSDEAETSPRPRGQPGP